MAKKFESRSKFPFVRDVSNLFGSGPRHHDNSVSLTKGTVRRKAKWFFIDALYHDTEINSKQGHVQKIETMVKKNYKDLNPEVHNWGSCMVVYWVTSLEEEMKTLKESK